MNLTSLLASAESALASYSDLLVGPLAGQEGSLQQLGRGLAALQAEKFASGLSVIVQERIDVSGMSATAFAQDHSGRITVSIRGTQFGSPVDLIACLEILTQGAAYSQIVSLGNWWRRVSGPAGKTVEQHRLASYQSGAAPANAVVLQDDGFSVLVLERADSAVASGEVERAVRGRVDQRVDVTGHSLGGHLAMAFSSLFSAQTSQVIVFDAPGFRDSTENRLFFQALGGLIPSRSDIVNVAADEALVDAEPFKLVAGLYSRPGTAIDIAIEDQWSDSEPAPFGARNHSMAILMDSLAVYRLLSGLTSEPQPLKETDYKLILAQAAQMGAASYERIVDALQDFFEIDAEPLGVGNPSRDELYEAIYGMQDSLTYRKWVGKVEVRPTIDSAEALLHRASSGEEGLAYRFAIAELNPFVLLAPDLYARYEAGGDRAGLLDAYDATSNPFGLTDEYLRHRAAFLERKLYISAQDLDRFYQHSVMSDTSSYPNAPDERGRTYQVQGRNYEDRESGFIASSEVNASSVEHLIFGRLGSDDLRGGAKRDFLFGGEGADYLDGKEDADYLEGGNGLDLYAYRTRTSGLASNDGQDSIFDVDGMGVIRYSETSGTVFNPVTTSRVIADASIRDTDAPERWRSADGKFTYTKEYTGTGSTDLVITFAGVSGGSIRIKDFRDGDLGIRLWDARTEPLISRTLIGTDEIDRLYGERLPPGGGDRIEGLAGNDVILADRPGGVPDNGIGDSDWVFGGEGRDDIDAGPGNDRVEAGPDGELNGDPGGDLIYGGAGDDELYANTRIDLDKAILQGDIAISLARKGDVLSGGAGNDWLIGAAARDALLGGGGKDLIVGGAGDDDIFGDLGNVAAIFGWSVSRDDGSTSGVVQARLNGFASADTSPGDADVVYAGRGLDWVFGGAGDDFIDGGPDNDLLFGEAGADVLIGGAGDDYLVGDNPGVVATGDERGDYLDGGPGNDTLQGDGGDDILVGGPGNDHLLGGAGKDVYIFKRGDGADILFDPVQGPDRSVLVRDANFDASQFTIRPGSMILDFGAGDSVAISSFDHNDPNSPEAFETLSFADGKRLSFADILTIGFTVNGTRASDDGTTNPIILGTAFRDTILALEGNDQVQSGEGNDHVDGGPGNDRLLAGAGDDHLIGGLGHDVLVGEAGNDILEGGSDNDWLWGGSGDDYLDGGDGFDQLFGGAGDDIYRFSAGDQALDPQGAVRVLFKASGGLAIEPGDISLKRELINGAPVWAIEHAPGSGMPVQRMHLRLSEDAQLAALEFADGRVLDHEALLRETWVDPTLMQGTALSDVLHGYAGDDVLRGAEGNDTLIGYGGSDRLEGGEGSDTLIGGPGDDALYGGAGDDSYIQRAGEGRDVVEDEGGLDTITFAGLRNDATLVRLPNGNLAIAFADNATLTVVGQYVEETRRVERLVFGDGTTVEVEELAALQVAPITGTPEADVLLGTQYGDVLHGLDGDDFLDGGGGDDILHGGAGADTYRLLLSGGVDRALDDGLQVSIVRLDAGVGFAHLAVDRAGDDLVVSIPGTATVMILTGYYAGQDAWTVRLYSGDEMPVADLIHYLARIHAPTTVSEWLDRYSELAKVSYLAYLTSFGYSGRAVFHDLGTSDAPFIQPGSTFHESISNTTRTAFMNVGVLTAGSSDNVVDLRGFGVLIVDAGEGNDLITNLGWGVNFHGTDAWGSFLHGGGGDDAIFGTWASDVIVGGDGSDYLDGSQGHDTYLVFRTDSGVDIIDEVSGEWYQAPDYFSDRGGGRYSRDILQLVDVNFEDVVLNVGVFDASSVNADGVHKLFRTLDIDYGTGLVRVVLPDPWIRFLDYNEGDLAGIETIRFADGVTLHLNEILDGFVLLPLGSPGDEATVTGSGADDNMVPLNRELRTALRGLGGNDYIEGGYADDLLDGGEGRDAIHSGSGDDLIIGGQGEDLLLGGSGSDTYVYRLGDGIDKVFDPSVAGQSNVVRFGPGIASPDISLGIGSLVLRIGSGGGAIHLESFEPRNPFGPRDIDRFVFWDGTELAYEALLARGFDITGTDGDDVLSGTATIDRLQGGRGDDVLAGGAGSDTYFYEAGDGLDIILEGEDESSTDVLRMGSGVAPHELSITRSMDDLIVSLPGDSDRLTLAGWFAVPGGTLERIEFTDGLSWTAAELEGRQVVRNRPPHTASSLPDQFAMEDQLFAYTLPIEFFVDPDITDTLAYHALLQDGSRLPPWLSFDLPTQTFTGTPLNADVGVLDIVVVATDSGGASASAPFHLEVLNTNDPPLLVQPLTDQAAVTNVAFSFAIPPQTFLDPDVGDALSYSASVLPKWLVFEPESRTLLGTPSAADVGTFAIHITATDQSGASVADSLDLTVSRSASALGEKIRALVFQGAGNSGGTVSNLIQALLAAQAHHLLHSMASFSPPTPADYAALPDAAMPSAVLVEPSI